MPSERRKFVRLCAPIGVRYSLVRTKKSQTSLSHDISGAGVRLYVKEELKKGELLEVGITLPNQAEVIKAMGEVVWTRLEETASKRQWEVGVKFHSIHPDDLNHIFQYVYGVGING